ncbi:MAG: thiamine pyrophosphate-binding protein [Acidimicrobiia bacterium]|nr:MAG: thiamine pyrophosphate-binding protein [Acidimicrobiia bacterium]
MAKIHGGQVIAKALKREGVDAVFMLTGGHILPMIDGCVTEGINVVDLRHEQAAAHAADAYARLTGKLGVAIVTAGPGVTDAITGVANAYFANTPMLVLGGRHLTKEHLRGGLQEMDHPKLFQSITVWSDTAYDAGRFPEYIAMAARHAFANRGGPVFLDIPWDVSADMVEETAIVWPQRYRANRPAGIPGETLDEIIAALENAESPVVFGGTGLRWTRQDGFTEQLDEFARALRAPVFLNSLARGSLPSGHPYLGNRARGDALRGADVILALGVDWDFRTGFGKKTNLNATVIQIDADPTKVGWNRDANVGVVADPGTVVAQLTGAVARIGRTEDPTWTTQVFEAERAKQEIADAASMSDDVPVHPERFAREVAEFFGEDSIVAADGGDIVSTTAKWLRTSRPGGLLDPGPFGCLGVGAPFAIAAKTVEPDTRVGIVYGDGSFGFNGMEFDTLVRNDMPVIGVVGNDGAWNNIKTIHRMLYPDRMVGADLGVRPYEKMVEGLGGYGEFVDKPTEIRPALERAAESGVPALVNVHIGEQLRMSSAYGF